MRRTVVVLVLLVVGIAAVVILLGKGLEEARLGGGGTSSNAENGELRTGPGDPLPGELTKAERRVRDAVLFGRPRAERVGQGAVHGRVVAVEDQKGVGGVRVLLAGVAYDETQVAVRATTDEEGAFRLASVPAGDGYALRVEAPGLPARTLPGLAVADDAVLSVGTVWLGAKGGLRGRVLDGAGDGIPNAEVTIHVGSLSLMDLLGNFTELFATLDREPVPLARTATDRDGAYVFEELDPGPVVVLARASGYEQAFRSTAVAAADESPRALDLHLAEGQRVSGRVIDEDDRGIGGARVAVTTSNDPFSFLYGRSFTQTGTDGRFVIDTAGSGAELQILVSAPGFAMAMHKATPGAQDVIVELRRGTTLTLRFLLEPDDTPLEGAQVWMTVGDDPDPTADERQAFGGGTTDRFGAVEVETGPGSLQMVWVSHADHSTVMWVGSSMAAVVPGMMKGPEDPTIRAGRQELEFRIPRGLTITGTVTAPDGSPVAGARVVSFGGMSLGKPAHTDAEGRYVLRTSKVGAGQGGGMAMVMVQASGYVQRQESTVVQLENADAREVVHDVELQSAGVVSGRVLDAAGRGVAGAEVRAEGGVWGMLGALESFLPVNSFTGTGGRYVLDGVPPGDGVRVLARHPNFVDAGTERFELVAGGSITGKDVTLTKGHVLEVEVTAPGGRLLPGAQVELSYEPADGVAWDFFEAFSDDVVRKTDHEGVLRQAKVPAGTVTITASHPDYAAERTVVEIPAAQAEPVRVGLELEPPVDLAGRVLDEAGNAVEGAVVTARASGKTNSVASATSTTDAEGRFRLARLASGEVYLTVRASGFEGHTGTVWAPATDLEVRLRKPDADREARKAKLYARMAELGTALQNAANDAEREALIAEIQELNKELQALEAPSDGR